VAAAGEVGAADVWEERESKTRKWPYYFHFRTGKARWKAPLSSLVKRGCRSPRRICKWYSLWVSMKDFNRKFQWNSLSIRKQELWYECRTIFE
jgi:hypothetical protein